MTRTHVIISIFKPDTNLKNPFTILLIDDDSDDRELFEIALEDSVHDVKCICLESCLLALQYLKGQNIKPDFIFLDLNMPEINGKECLLELKRNLILSKIPVVIFSTSDDPADIRDTLSLGAVEFMTKPAKVSSLTTLVDHFITQYTMKKPTHEKRSN